MTLVLLARHGETDWNAEHRFMGHADRPLNDRGRAQAAELADRLADTPLAAVVASDLRRAHETAEPIAARHALPVRLESGLREVDVGSWSGLTAAEARARFPGPYARWREEARAGWEGGETYEAMGERAVETILRLAEEYEPSGLPVLVVGHGGTIRAIQAAAEGIDQRTIRRLRRVVPNASLDALRVRDGALVEFQPDVPPGALVGSAFAD